MRRSAGDWALKALGLLLMLAALGFAVSKAPDRPLDSLVPQLFAHKGLEHRIFARTAPPQAREEVRVWRVGHHRELVDVLLGRVDADPQEIMLSHLLAGFEEPARFSSLPLRKTRTVKAAS